MCISVDASRSFLGIIMVKRPVECAGAQQYSDASSVCMVLKIQLLFLLNVMILTEDDALLGGSSTQHCMYMCCWGPVKLHWFLDRSPGKLLEVSTLKYSEIYCMTKEDESWLTFNDTSQCREAAMAMNIGQQGLGASRCFRKLLRVTSEKQQEAAGIR